jgi:hypothetical protein
MAAFKRVGSSVSSRSSGSELDEWDSEMVASLVNTHGLRVPASSLQTRSACVGLGER